MWKKKSPAPKVKCQQNVDKVSKVKVLIMQTPPLAELNYFIYQIYI